MEQGSIARPGGWQSHMLPVAGPGELSGLNDKTFICVV